MDNPAGAEDFENAWNRAEESMRGAGVPEGEEWSDPEPLPDGLPPVVPFDLILLPDRLRPWVSDVAERMQAPIDYPAVAAMVTLGSAVGRQLGIKPKQYDDWTVVPNLWGGAVGRPGVMKTPALQEACRPLNRLEMATKEAHREALEEYEAQQRVAKQQKKLADEQIAKDLKAKRDPKGIVHDLIALRGDDGPPARRRYITMDSTVEKLGEVLRANPNGVLVFRDELTGLLRQMDRDGHEADRAFYLESWNGTGRFTFDRIGRGTIDIEACCVSMLGGIQPGPLAAYLERMVRGGSGDDGLMQRLQMLVWPDVSKVWRNIDRAPDAAARQTASELFDQVECLTAICPAGEDGEIPCLRFDPAAQSAFDAYRTALETRLRSGDLHPAMEAHLSKYRSLVPSLALLCHLADVGATPVGTVALHRALAWAEYLETHARRIYDSVIRAELCAARTLGEHIEAGDLPSPFRVRDVYRPCWSGLTTPASAQAAIDVLVDFHWLRAEGAEGGASAGRPSKRYHINPKVCRV